MTQEEYIKTIIYNGHMINVGINDGGQTYIIEFVEDGVIKEECVGAYVTNYMGYIEYRFGVPEINCPVYDDVITTNIECCTKLDQAFCGKCRKRWNDINFAAWQKRQEEFAKWLEEN